MGSKVLIVLCVILSGVAIATAETLFNETYQAEEDKTSEVEDVTNEAEYKTNEAKYLTNKGEEVNNEAVGITHEGEDVTHEGEDITHEGEDITHDGDDITHEDENITHGGKDITHESEDITHEGEDNTHEGEDITHEGEDTVIVSANNDLVQNNGYYNYNGDENRQEGFMWAFIEGFAAGIDNVKCRNHTLLYLNSLTNYTMWAVKMLDSTAKIPEGVLEGNIRSLGDFDECLAVRATADDADKELWGQDEIFRGQYCLANLHIKVKPGADRRHIMERFLHIMTAGRKSLEITRNRKGNFLPYFALFEWAICVPSSCAAEDVESGLNKLFNGLVAARSLEIDVKVQEDYCNVKEPLSFYTRDFAMAAIIMLFLMAVGGGSLYDMFIWRKKNEEGKRKGALWELLVAFSIPENLKRLMNTSAPKGSFLNVDGIRFFTMLWVICTHKVFSMSREPWRNKLFLLETAEDIWKMPIQNSMLNVDTFFVIGGMLRAYNMMNDLEEKRFRYFSGFLQRYLRLTPAYGMVIAFYASLLVYLGNGPTWNRNIVVNSQNCRDNWSFNFLFVNNYIDVHDMCLPHSWYLAADMQLFLIAPLIIYPLWKWKNLGKFLLGFFSFISIAVLFVIIFLNKHLGVQSAGHHDSLLQAYTVHVYLPTHMRTSSYVVGLGLGYIFYRLKDEKEFKFPKYWLAACWGICLLTLFAVIFGPYEMMLPDRPYRVWDQAFYGALHRFAWAMAVAWVIFSCHKGHGGMINTVLSHGLLRPLSRLTYCAYLVHFAVIMIGTSKLRTAIYMDDYFVIHSFVADTAVSITVAAIVYLCVEQPFLNIVKLIFRREK